MLQDGPVARRLASFKALFMIGIGSLLLRLFGGLTGAGSTKRPGMGFQTKGLSCCEAEKVRCAIWASPTRHSLSLNWQSMMLGAKVLGSEGGAL